MVAPSVATRRTAGTRYDQRRRKIRQRQDRRLFVRRNWRVGLSKGGVFRCPEGGYLTRVGAFVLDRFRRAGRAHDEQREHNRGQPLTRHRDQNTRAPRLRRYTRRARRMASDSSRRAGTALAGASRSSRLKAARLPRSVSPSRAPRARNAPSPRPEAPHRRRRLMPLQRAACRRSRRKRPGHEAPRFRRRTYQWPGRPATAALPARWSAPGRTAAAPRPSQGSSPS